MNRVAIIVLNWNGVSDTLNCLDSLINLEGNNFHIVVVDNGSSDNSVEQLSSYINKATKKELFTLLQNKNNRGFAGGVNTGIKWALENKFEAVALFNSDAIADKNWLKNLLKVFDKHKEVGIVTGLLLHKDGKTIDSTGEFYSKWGLAFPRSRDKKTNLAPDSGYVFGATGGASLYRTSMLSEVGIFDESFFAYYEDVDISFRAQLSGWRVYYTNESIAYHEQGGTSKKVPGFTIQQTFRNLPLLYLKNVPRRFLFTIGIRFWLAYWLIFFNTFRHGTTIYAIKGWLMSIVYTPSALIKRFSIQKNKKVSSDYIWSIIWQDLPPEQDGMRRFRKIFGDGK